MALILHQLVQDYLPIKRRQNQKGWIVFNSVCCHHRGHSQDTRARGNLLISSDGNMIVNCYNCGFKTGYRGGDLSSGLEIWLRYLGVPQAKIQEAKLEILSKKLSGELDTIDDTQWFRTEHFPEVQLPKHSNTIEHWLTQDDLSDDFIKCVEYLTNRGRAVASSYHYYWTPITRWDLNNRIIIPFFHHNKIVGWTGRYCGIPPNNVPRYFNSDIPTGYLFNNQVMQNQHRQYVLITEGPFDAIAVDGVAALGSKMNKQQIAWLNSIDQEKVIVPDRQLKNQELIDIALEQGWSVSFPDWDDKIKDAAQASATYGRLYTIASVIKARTNSKLQINMKRQMMRG